MERAGAAAGSALIVDDDEGVRSLVSDLLERARFATRAVASGSEALEAVAEAQPDVVVLDVELPGISGYEVCRELRERFGSAISILFLSGRRTDGLDRAAGLLLGADDYVVKPFEPDELLQRVRGLSRRSPAPATSALTKREAQVLALLSDGLSTAEIAAALSVTVKTAGKHIEHILGKLGVHSRAQAVAYAYRHRGRR